MIVSTIDANPVTVLCGETGCGKSTQTPTMILEHMLGQGKTARIFCTEPRRISAISLAQRVSQELGDMPGALGTRNSYVGYNIRLEARVSAATRLTYATTVSPKAISAVTSSHPVIRVSFFACSRVTLSFSMLRMSSSMRCTRYASIYTTVDTHADYSCRGALIRISYSSFYVDFCGAGLIFAYYS